MASLTTAPKVTVIGAGWAGLGATYHLAKQGYEVTLLEAGAYPGGLVAGWKTDQGKSVEAGIHGFWYPYQNIFGLVDELGLKPFTDWTRSAQYSPNGLEVESPIFQDCPPLPAPMGTFLYTQFKRLPVWERATALPLLYAMIDFDNSDEAWRRYDKMSARELFQKFGVSERLYKEAFEPMLLVGLFAPGEQCSAAATLGMLYYFIIAHQPDFDVVWCRGTVGAEIFRPWCEAIEALGGKILTGKRVTDISLDAQGNANAVICGEEQFETDAVISSVGISGLQNIISSSATLGDRAEFANVMNLGSVDVLATRLWLDRKVNIPRPSNAGFGFDETTGWTFFDLNALHDEYRDAAGTVIEADFYHANQLMAMSDGAIVEKVQRDIATCVPAVGEANVIDSSVIRLKRAVTHFAPGSYQHLLPRQTSIPNLYMSGDWVVTRHGSWSQEKAYVTGLEAANAVIQQFANGETAKIIPIQPDEPQVQVLRELNRALRGLLK
ncbi:FAD-dependent oxidoreductase [filamentous cyanobacterium LEGE 11480]|uniref:FAD-dependent oxidoreductase n=1 Tax=Romeriopsis navalis LEGE 11480 TaxID=2777977 RepID=A0A928VPS3_9CYAN|nr:FAD-dependent oxidoreductase [Romeriopsis navalis]MBE9029844.1 FAD-dependent oxidoreductase [Romeriopsis navalis LEGE 11480]